MEAQSAGGSPRRDEGGSLAAGSTIAGRYQIVRLVRHDAFGEVYEALTASGQTPCTLHLLSRALTGDKALLSQVGDDVRRAAGVAHTGVAQVLELGADEGNLFLVTELTEGHTLRELLQRKRDTGQAGFGVKGAANIALHLAAALAAVHEAVAHGAISLDSVVVSRSGRVKVGGLGLAALAPLAARRGAAPATAPEVIAGGRPSAAADIYGLGAVLYEILVGSPPVKGCMRPSEALPGLPASIDQLVARCMSPAPGARPGSVLEVRDAIAAALSDRTSAAQPAARPSAAREAPKGGSLAESLSPAGSGVTAAVAAPTVAEGEERWLISKGKLDYGPFTFAAVAEQIRTSQILPGHVIIDKDTGERTKIENHPLLTEMVEIAKQRRDEERRAQAEVAHASQEKRRGATLYVVIGLAVVGLGGGGYLLYNKLTAHKDDGNKGAISGLAAGSVEATMSFPTKAERTARRSSRKGGGRGAASGGVAGGWNDTVELDMDEEGGDERLDDAQVNPVLQRSGGALGRCLMSSGTRKANIEFIVVGAGKVSQVRVNGETGSAVAGCVRGVMKSMQFPPFDGKRSKHYFDMAY